ncbi:MAG: hypothetical protein CVU09_10825 [Bacteroidetes bacterium HGW-Bacteroidetes-4]|jgi:hypothetical protein|nr:MAG: hypothetical protein CVU09_10825 [Bacteroidetes bacterium HGW-Bacteroidetes-4]
MIQRIQTLFLVLAAALLVAMYWFPLASFTANDVIYKLFACRFQHPETGIALIATLPLAVLPCLSAILSLIIVFKYKNRVLQMRLCKLVMLVLATALLVEAIYFFRIGPMLNTSGQWAFGAIFPFIALLLEFLAHRNIKKDEKLVRSADRIR